MLPFRELRPSAAELREMVRLASPVVIAQVGIMLMGVVDTAMVGRVSADAVAAVALGAGGRAASSAKVMTAVMNGLLWVSGHSV